MSGDFIFSQLKQITWTAYKGVKIPALSQKFRSLKKAFHTTLKKINTKQLLLSIKLIKLIQ